MLETKPISDLKASKDVSKYIKNLRWYILGLLLFATTINYLDRATLGVAASELRKTFGMSNQDYSYIVSAFMIAYAITMPFAGRIVDWLGTRAGFAMAVVWWATANICTSIASGVRSFAFFRFMLGVGEAGNFPAAVKTVSEWFPAKERAMATGIYNLGAGFGAIIAPVLVTWSIMTWGWQAAFIVTGIFDFVWVILWLLFYRSPEKHPRLSPEELKLIRDGQETDSDSKQRKMVWKEIIGKRQLWGCILAKFCTDPIWWFYLFWLPSYLSDARGFSLKEIAIFAWLPFLTADFGSVFGGGLSSLFIKFGRPVLTARKMAMCICAAMMPIALLAVRAQSPFVAIACICIATLAHQSWSANLLTLPADLFPRRQVASAFGLAGSAGAWGGLLFTLVVGKMVDSMGYVPVFTIAGIMHIIAAVLVLILVSKPATQNETSP